MSGHTHLQWYSPLPGESRAPTPSLCPGWLSTWRHKSVEQSLLPACPTACLACLPACPPLAIVAKYLGGQPVVSPRGKGRVWRPVCCLTSEMGQHTILQYKPYNTSPWEMPKFYSKLGGQWQRDARPPGGWRPAPPCKENNIINLPWLPFTEPGKWGRWPILIVLALQHCVWLLQSKYYPGYLVMRCNHMILRFWQGRSHTTFWLQS